MAPKKQCPAVLASGAVCNKEAKYPEGDPIVCGNHAYKIVDGVFCQDATKVPATPPKPALQVKRDVQQESELQNVLALIVGEDANNLAFKVSEHKHKITIEIAHKKNEEQSPAFLQMKQQNEAQAEEIAALRAQLAAAGLDAAPVQ